MIGTYSRIRSLGPTALALVLLVSIAPAAASAGGELATATVYSGGVDIRALYEYRQAIATVTGNGIVIRRVLEPGDDLSISVFDLEGDLLPDGVYNWQLELVPDDAAARQLRLEATANGGVAPEAWRPETGTMAIRGGLVAMPDLEEPGGVIPSGLESSVSSFGSGLDSGFASKGLVEDDDAAVGFRVGVEKAMRADQSAAPSPPAGNSNFERSDAGAVAAGQSLEPKPQTSLDGAAPPAPRSISPDGKHGRPRSRDEVR